MYFPPFLCYKNGEANIVNTLQKVFFIVDYYYYNYYYGNLYQNALNGVNSYYYDTNNYIAKIKTSYSN